MTPLFCPENNRQSYVEKRQAPFFEKKTYSCYTGNFCNIIWLHTFAKQGGFPSSKNGLVIWYCKIFQYHLTSLFYQKWSLHLLYKKLSLHHLYRKLSLHLLYNKMDPPPFVQQNGASIFCTKSGGFTSRKLWRHIILKDFAMRSSFEVLSTDCVQWPCTCRSLICITILLFDFTTSVEEIPVSYDSVSFSKNGDFILCRENGGSIFWKK